MPNYCYGQLVVRGYKPNVDEFIKILQAHYNYNTGEITHKPHFYRVFEADVYDYYETRGLNAIAFINLEVAWSIWVCMFNGPHTYYNNTKDLPNRFGSHIEAESKRLNLEIEIFSEETGMCFQEYYKLQSGILCKEEVFPLHSYYLGDFETLDEYINDYTDGEDLEEFIKDHGDDWLPTRDPEEYKKIRDENWTYEPDRIDWDTTILDNPKYLCHKIMCKSVNKE